jgi:hypothetical protein
MDDAEELRKLAYFGGGCLTVLVGFWDSEMKSWREPDINHFI